MSVEPPSVTEPGAEGVRTAAAAFFDRFPRAKPMLVLAVAILVLNVLTLRTVSEVSAVDEREHIDYLLRGSHGRIGQHGDPLTQETLRELCSRGSHHEVDWPPCRPGRLDPRDFSPRGINTSVQGPSYYLVTGLGARVLRAAAPGWESLVTWGRALASLWLLLGCYLALRGGELLGFPRWPLVVVLLLVAALPAQLQASTAVNPDAMSFLSGAAVLLAVLAWERRGRGLWVLGISAAVAGAFDSTNAVGILVVLVYLALRAIGTTRGVGPDPRLPPARCSVAGAVLVIGAVVAVGSWEVGSRSLAHPGDVAASADRETAAVSSSFGREDGDEGLSVREVLSVQSVFGMFPPVVDVAPPARRGPDATWYGLFAVSAGFLILGALIATCLHPLLRERLSILGVAVVTALLVAGPLFQVYRYLVYGFTDPVVPRFGLSALPAIALVLAGLARDRIPLVILSTVAAGLFAAALGTLL